MNRAITFPAILILTLSAGATHGAIKCWTNNEGVRECGDRIPPEYAQKRSEELNERGMTVNIRERAKTAEEVESERRQQAIEAQRRAEEERRRQQQAAYDRVLLSTFISEAEIVASRDRKVEAIDGTIEVTRLAIGKLEQKLAQYRQRADNLERAGREPPAELQENIESAQSQIADNQAFVARKEEEKAALKEKYQRDIERFRELKARR